MNNIIRDYINIDYNLFIKFDNCFLNTQNKLNGTTFAKHEINNIKYIKTIFRVNSIYLNNKDIDYNNILFICFDCNDVCGYDCVVFPLSYNINYFNDIIKPKFDKYLKLQAFI